MKYKEYTYIKIILIHIMLMECQYIILKKKDLKKNY